MEDIREELINTYKLVAQKYFCVTNDIFELNKDIKQTYVYNRHLDRISNLHDGIEYLLDELKKLNDMKYSSAKELLDSKKGDPMNGMF